MLTIGEFIHAIWLAYWVIDPTQTEGALVYALTPQDLEEHLARLAAAMAAIKPYFNNSENGSLFVITEERLQAMLLLIRGVTGSKVPLPKEELVFAVYRMLAACGEWQRLFADEDELSGVKDFLREEFGNDGFAR